MPNNSHPDKRHKNLSAATSKLARRSVNSGYLIGGLVLIVCMFVFLRWFWQNFEQVSSKDYVLKTQAQYNPYYASELLLNSHYARISDTDTDFDENENEDEELTDTFATTLLDSDIKILLNELPYIDDMKLAQGERPTLIINSIGTKLTEIRFNALKSWVEQGGHLITFTSRTSNSDDMKAVLERLSTLQAQSVSIEAIANDEILNELTAALDSGNDFLNQLGIFRVAPDGSSYISDGSDEDNISAELEDLLGDAAQQTASEQDSSSDSTSETFVKDRLAELSGHKPLSLLQITHEDEQNILLVKVGGPSNDSRFNAQLFQALYPSNAEVHAQYPEVDDKAVVQQAQLIRHYIKEIVANNDILVPQKNTANNLKTQSAKNQSAKHQKLADNDLIKLPELLTAILALSDAQLVELFVPIDNIYLDATFGAGRISVINNNSAFGNPNPNTELPDSYDSAGNDSDGNDYKSSAVLYELLAQNSFYSSLLSADNAAWLLDLTKNSSQVWILPNTDIDPLPVMLWKQAKPAVLGLGLLGLIWLWSLYNRFGKTVSLPTGQTRDILRYFRQIGRFGWHQDRAQKLMQTTKNKVRLLAEDNLKSDFDYRAFAINALDDLDSVSHAGNDHSEVPATRIDKLHELLIARLDSKKSRLRGSLHSSDHTIDNDNLLLSNEAFIRETIEHDRLRRVFESDSSSKKGVRGKNDAAEFTRMTQTLWMIQWLLR